MNAEQTPFVSVYYGVTKVSDLLVDFSYRYSEEEDDVAQLKFQSDSSSLADKPYLQEDAVLSLIWGYIGGQQISRLVKVSDIRLHLTAKMITVDILCTDVASKSKSDSRNRVWEDADITDVLGQAGNDNDLNVEIDGDSIKTNTNTIDNKQVFFYEDGRIVSAKDKLARPRTYMFKQYDTIPQANRSDYQLLKKMAKDEPGGPWRVTGRDDKLTLKKIDLSAKPSRTYTYQSESGHLLEFAPEEKGFSKHQSATEIGFTGFDPENKTGFEGSANAENTGTTSLGEYVDVNNKNKRKLTGIESIIGSLNDVAISTFQQVNPFYDGPSPAESFINAVDNTANVFSSDKSLEGDTTQKPEAIRSMNSVIVDPDTVPVKDLKSYVEQRKNSKQVLRIEEVPKEDLEGNDSIGSFKLVKYSTESYNYSKINERGTITTGVDKTTTLSRYAVYGQQKRNKIVTPEQSPEEAQRAANNEQDEKALQKNPGKVLVLGDPTLTSGVIIGFLNVGSKYSGNYYIPECTHNISRSGGYTVDLVISRNAVNKPEEVPVNKQKADNLDNKTSNNKETNSKPPVTQNSLKSDSTTTLVEHYKKLGFIDPSTPDSGTPYIPGK